MPGDSSANVCRRGISVFCTSVEVDHGKYDLISVWYASDKNLANNFCCIIIQA